MKNLWITYYSFVREEDGYLIYVLEDGTDLDVKNRLYNENFYKSLLKIVIIPYKKGYFYIKDVVLRELLEVKEVLNDLIINQKEFFNVGDSFSIFGKGVNLEGVLNKYSPNIKESIKNDLRIVKGKIASITKSDFKKFKYYKSDKPLTFEYKKLQCNINIAEYIHKNLITKTKNEEMNLIINKINKGINVVEYIKDNFYKIIDKEYFMFYKMMLSGFSSYRSSNVNDLNPRLVLLPYYIILKYSSLYDIFVDGQLVNKYNLNLLINNTYIIKNKKGEIYDKMFCFDKICVNIDFNNFIKEVIDGK